jgi:signal transduction histidine kinase
VLATVIFLIAPATLIFYVSLYNSRKKKHSEEKKQLEQLFKTELIKSRMEAREQTLKTVAAELHDNIGQILSLASVTLSFIDPTNQADCSAKINNAEQLIKRSVNELRQLSRVLYGEQLLQHGLATAMQTELDWMEKTGRYLISYNQTGNSKLFLDPEKEIISFRLFQEVVSNIIKHAEASRIDVALDAKDDRLLITITDNGKGFDPDIQQGNGLGLETVKKRAMLMGGSVSMRSQVGAGTRFEIIIPNQNYHGYTN